jgi:fatty-acid peroxygenase
VLLDLFGTNRDPRIWDEPTAFRPERFRTWTGDPFRLIPQGGGSHFTGHRCAGEWITIELLKRAAQHLGSLEFQVPAQDLRVHLSRMPAQPASGFVMKRVRSRGDVLASTTSPADKSEPIDADRTPDRRQF